MAQLKITSTQAAILIGLRSLAQTDSNRKQAKKDLFNSLRTQFSIPANVKLKVEIDDRASPDYLVLKDRASGRELVGTGYPLRYSHVAPAPAPVTGQTLGYAGQPATQDTARFSVAGAQSSGVKSVAVSALLTALRDGDYLDFDDDTLPAGAPALSDDQVLLDNQTGKLFFLAED